MNEKKKISKNKLAENRIQELEFRRQKDEDESEKI